ncbi:MAG: hypothetical protein ACLSEU_04695 [Streptococcus salivarius]
MTVAVNPSASGWNLVPDIIARKGKLADDFDRRKVHGEKDINHKDERPLRIDTAFISDHTSV